MAIKKKTPPIKSAIKPFMAPGFNPPKKDDTRGPAMPAINTGTVKKKKSNVSSGKGLDLIKDKMRSKVQKAKMNVRSSTVSRGSAKVGGGNNLCKSKSKF